MVEFFVLFSNVFSFLYHPFGVWLNNHKIAITYQPFGLFGNTQNCSISIILSFYGSFLQKLFWHYKFSDIKFIFKDYFKSFNPEGVQ